MLRPSGTVTFLFTDIQGSTRRWESDRDSMSAALLAHDQVLRVAVESQGGWLFKHTGDGVCAAFGTARNAIDAAISAQRQLDLPVRMGIATGEADLRDDDYFGPTLNRVARVMDAGHGGQILVAASTAALVGTENIFDLGMHRLRDLSGTEHLHQVIADGLAAEFPAPRTLEATPGNLPQQSTSFVGRGDELKVVTELLRANRMVTLTGVGGVGKTRLALQVAAGLLDEFPDGVWLVELAPVGDPDALADAVATALGVTPLAGMTVTANIARALAGRRLLLVLDNCEHVLDASADLVELVLERTTTAKVLITSREGLRLGAEHLWPVPSLDLRAGISSTAVELFVERAQAGQPAFELETREADAAAVLGICKQLDGIALAIELAAARMVSMSPGEVLDRLGDRFRLLSGSRRGLERHQTLRQAVQWSYDLLDDGEAGLLECCSVFAGGFDLPAATHLYSAADEFLVLDLLDSLVRKSLITTERVNGLTRYGMLETIRQFAEERLAATGAVAEVRGRHARYFASSAVAFWEMWEGPGYRVAVDWVDVEFANLRSAFRWAMDNADHVTAAAIAAHSATLGFFLQFYEPIGWAEEALPAATSANLAHLPRLYSAAGLCNYVGRLDDASRYSQSALALEADARYDPFDAGWSHAWAVVAEVMASGDLDRWFEVCRWMTAQDGFARVVGLGWLVYMLPVVGQGDEARALAMEAVSAARAHGNPVWIAAALQSSGRAFTDADPARALVAFREALALTRRERIPWLEARTAQESARLEAIHGDLQTGLDLFDAAIDSFQQSGNPIDLAAAFAELAVFFHDIEEPETAAVMYGMSTHTGDITWVMDLATSLHRVRARLGDTVFEEHVALGAAMTPIDALRHTRAQIQRVRDRDR